MRSIKVVRAERVRVKPYVPYSFTQNEDFLSTIRRLERLHRKNSKRYDPDNGEREWIDLPRRRY